MTSFILLKKVNFFTHADDNTLSYSHTVFATLIETLERERESANLVEWFTQNQMKASLDKFQVLAVGEKTHDKMPTFKTGEAEIRCERTVKLLGVEIGYLLKFDDQII